MHLAAFLNKHNLFIIVFSFILSTSFNRFFFYLVLASNSCTALYKLHEIQCINDVVPAPDHLECCNSHRKYEHKTKKKKTK